MKDHYDIGVAGFWFGANYGSLLNGFAMYRTLKNLGKSVLMIHKMGIPDGDPELISGHNVDFVKKYYNADDISGHFSYDRLSELNKYCDCFCAGSDQVWNYPISFDENMYLPFADETKKLISFASSFGNKTGNIPVEAKERIKKYLKRFDAISVRENFSQHMLQNEYGIQAKAIIEPVFLLESKEYESMAQKSKYKFEGNYILIYILDPTEEKRKAILEYSKALNLKVISILDGKHFIDENDLKNKKMHDFAECIDDIGCEEFLNAFKNASFVITDSFHGTAFSIIFRKNFISIGNEWRGIDRFTDLLGRLGRLDRLVIDANKISFNQNYLQPIDYTKTAQLIEQEKKEALLWLKNATEAPGILKSVACKLNIEELCVGCSSCVSSCPVKAIKMVQDVYGNYKAEVDKKKCIGCELCSKRCPAIELPNNNNFATPQSYSFVLKDKNALMKSTSGGAFFAIAKTFLQKKNGVVYGVALDSNLKAIHIRIEKEQDLSAIQKSKYMQSMVGDSFLNVKKDLQDNRNVLFSGCPCQIAGLKKYLEKEYENLLLVDLFCTCCPSEKIINKYISENYGNNSSTPITDFEFRHKNLDDKEWSGSYISYKQGKEEKVVKLPPDSFYSKLFILAPKHCEKCQFQNQQRQGDISLGDAWGINTYDPAVDRRFGVSAITLNNKKGVKFFSKIDKYEYDVCKQELFDDIKRFNNASFYAPRNWPTEKYRKAFYENILVNSFNTSFEKAMKEFKDVVKGTKVMTFGSCVTRDILRYHPNYSVVFDVQRNLLSNLVAPQIEINNWEPLEKSALPSFEKICATYNYTKWFKDDLVNYDADYLILDLAEERWNTLRLFDKNNYCHYLFYPNYKGYESPFKKTMDEVNEKNGFNTKVIQLQDVNYQTLRSRYAQAVDVLLKKYKQSRIIIVDVRMAHQYLLNNKTLRTYNHEYWNIDASNKHLDNVYNILYELLPESPRIKMPEYTLGQENHLWGAAPLHFMDEYYLYLGNALDIITGRSHTHTLDQLWKEQSLRNKILYDQIISQNVIEQLQRRVEELEKRFNSEDKK